MLKLLTAIAAAACLTIAPLPQQHAPTLQMNVIHIIDGDTFTCQKGGNTVTLRAAHIDAPELSQRYGDSARIFADSILRGKTITVKHWTIDKYGRIVGDILIGNTRFANEMIRAGAAWHYKAYSQDPTLAHAERRAKQERRGLWKDPYPTPPWVFRHSRTNSSRISQNKRIIDSIFHAKPYLGKIVK